MKYFINEELNAMEGVTLQTVSESKTSPNPHTLWIQIVGMVMSSAIQFLFIGNIFLIATGVFVFCDAWVSGIYKKPEVKTFTNISPVAWGIVMQFLFIVSFPLYLIVRNRLKTKEASPVFFIFTIIFGAITAVLAVLWVLTAQGQS